MVTVVDNGNVFRERNCRDCLRAEDAFAKMEALFLRLCLLIDDGDDKGVNKRIGELDRLTNRVKALLDYRKIRRNASQAEEKD